MALLFSNNKYFSKMYILVWILALRLFDAHARDGARSRKLLAEIHVQTARPLLRAKWTHVHDFLTSTDGKYTCEM